MNDYTGIEFLDKLYQNLYMSDEVQHTRENTDNRKEAIQKYMDRLERIHKKSDTETKKELLYSLYFDKYVIKEENIPYYLDKEAIINAQKKSLGMWLDYLSNETANYPTWAKYWAFQGMLKMGSYDEAKEVYLKRDKKTIAPFVSANAEIIAKSIETITKLVNGQEVTPILEEKFNKTDSFNKIYTVFEKKYKKNIEEKSDNIDGEWKKYNQGSREDAIELSKSLENMNTGWCTASEDMAIKQICGPYDTENGGDFYVYYTKNNNGEYSIPRIAIRLNNHDEIGEIRGIDEGQNLEEKMIDILENKLREMSFLSNKDIKENLDKVEGLRELTRLGKKTENKEVLTEKELIDLYSKEFGFGWTQDPRVKKVQDKRNKLDDYNNINNKEIKVMFLTRKILPEGVCVNDKEIVLEAAKNKREAFKYASEELRSNRETILELVKQDGGLIQYASEELKNDKEVVIEAVKQKGYAFTYASEELKKDKEFILELVKYGGYTLKFASEEIKKDKEVVIEAVKEFGRALEAASEELKNDKEVVLEAIKEDAGALQFASEELKNDKSFILEILKQKGHALQYVSEELKNDREVILEAVRQDGRALKHVPKKLKHDREIVLEAVRQNGFAFEDAPKEFINDKEVVLEAIKQNDYCIHYISNELRKDRAFLEKVNDEVNKIREKKNKQL